MPKKTAPLDSNQTNSPKAQSSNRQLNSGSEIIRRFAQERRQRLAQRSPSLNSQNSHEPDHSSAHKSSREKLNSGRELLASFRSKRQIQRAARIEALTSGKSLDSLAPNIDTDINNSIQSSFAAVDADISKNKDVESTLADNISDMDCTEQISRATANNSSIYTNKLQNNSDRNKLLNENNSLYSEDNETQISQFKSILNSNDTNKNEQLHVKASNTYDNHVEVRDSASEIGACEKSLTDFETHKSEKPLTMLPEIGEGMRQSLQNLGIIDLVTLAAADPQKLRQDLGVLSKIAHVDGWIKRAQSMTNNTN